MCTHTHTPLAWSPFDSPTCLPTPYGKSTSLRLSKRLCSFLVHLIYGEYHPKIKFGHIETYVNNLISLLWSRQRQVYPKNAIPKTVHNRSFLSIVPLITSLFSWHFPFLTQFYHITYWKLFNMVCPHSLLSSLLSVFIQYQNATHPFTVTISSPAL